MQEKGKERGKIRIKTNQILQQILTIEVCSKICRNRIQLIKIRIRKISKDYNNVEKHRIDLEKAEIEKREFEMKREKKIRELLEIQPRLE